MPEPQEPQEPRGPKQIQVPDPFLSRLRAAYFRRQAAYFALESMRREEFDAERELRSVMEDIIAQFNVDFSTQTVDLFTGAVTETAAGLSARR